MENARQENSLDLVFFMLTNILTESTDLICEGNGALQLAERPFIQSRMSPENRQSLWYVCREWYPERSS